MILFQCTSLFCYRSSSFFQSFRFARRIANRTKRNRNFYEILGVNKQSTDAEIKDAYYSLVKQHHPDSNSSSDSPDQFIEIKEAYDTLRNADKRRQYDFDQQQTSSNAGQQQRPSSTWTYDNRYNWSFEQEMERQRQRQYEETEELRRRHSTAYDEFMRATGIHRNGNNNRSSSQSDIDPEQLARLRQMNAESRRFAMRVLTVFYMSVTIVIIITMAFLKKESWKRDMRRQYPPRLD